MRGYYHLLFWFAAGWLLLLVWVYQSLGATAPDRASIEFLLALSGVLIGGLAFVIVWVIYAVREYDGAGGLGEPDIVPGKPKWDEEFDTGSTGDELEDLGLVKQEPPLPSESGRRGS
jgi:hypothetical protein